MRNNLITLVLLTSTAFHANAQTEIKSSARSQSVFLEVLSNGFGLSVNYDARFARKEDGFGFRVGVGVVPAVDYGLGSLPGFITIPVGVNYLTGQSADHLELGLGVTGAIAEGNFSTTSIFGDVNSSNKFVIALVPSIGYRYARPGKGIQFRVVLSPVISSSAVFFGGISIGYKF